MEEFLREHGFEEAEDYDDVLECNFDADDPILAELGIDIEDGDFATIQFNMSTCEAEVFWDGGYSDNIDLDELREVLS